MSLLSVWTHKDKERELAMVIVNHRVALVFVDDMSIEFGLFEI